MTMGTIMLLRHDPTATPVLVLVLAPVLLTLLALTGLLFTSAGRHELGAFSATRSS